MPPVDHITALLIECGSPPNLLKSYYYMYKSFHMYSSESRVPRGCFFALQVTALLTSCIHPSPVFSPWWKATLLTSLLKIRIVSIPSPCALWWNTWFLTWQVKHVTPSSTNDHSPHLDADPRPRPSKMPCGHSMNGRNLIVCIDGTSNQFGEKVCVWGQWIVPDGFLLMFLKKQWKRTQMWSNYITSS